MKTINNFCEHFLEMYLDEKLRQLRMNRHKIPPEEWNRILNAVNDYLWHVESTFSILKEKENLKIISPEEKKELDSIREKSEFLFQKLDEIVLQTRHNALNKSMNSYYYAKSLSKNGNEKAKTTCIVLKNEYQKMIMEWFRFSEN